MSFVVKDVRCADGHVEVNVLVDREAGPTACACGLPRTTFYATREMEVAARNVSTGGASTFKEFTIDDGTRITSQAGLDRYIDMVAKRTNTPRDTIILESRVDRHQRSDEARHRAWQTRKDNGFDNTQTKEWQRDAKRRSAEAKEQRR